MKHKLPLFFLALLCLALGVLAFFKHTEVGELQKRVAALEGAPDAAAEAAMPNEPVAKPVPKVASPEPMFAEPLVPQPTAPPVPDAVAAAPDQQELLDDAHGLISELVEEREKKKKEEANPMAALGKMLEKPEMRDMMDAQLGMQMTMAYGRFFDRANLDPETKESLQKLLTERAGAQMNSGFEFMKLAKEDREAFGAEMENTDEAYEAEIQKLLGAERAAEFDQWETELPKRMALDQISAGMRGDNALSEKQEEELVRLMLLRDEEFTGSSLEEISKPGKIPTKDMMEGAIKRQAELNELYVQDAKVLLSESQHEVFVKGVENHQKMMEFGVKLGAQFLGDEE